MTVGCSTCARVTHTSLPSHHPAARHDVPRPPSHSTRPALGVHSNPEAGRRIWETLLAGPDAALMHVIRIDRRGFDILQAAFELIYPSASDVGRPRKQSPAEILGMVLHWYGGTMDEKTAGELQG